MGVLNEAVQLITQPPGSLVYYLVTLFALQQALFSALGARRSAAHSSLAQRWVWAVSGMLMVRIALIVVGFLSLDGWITPLYVLPALERWFIFASALALTWAAVAGFEPRRWQTGLLLVLLAGGLMFYGYAILAQAEMNLGSDAPSNLRLWQQILVLLALTAAALSALIRRAPQWEWILGISLAWILGTLAQLIWGQPDIVVDGWQRLASLVAMPLLSILVHRQVLAERSSLIDGGIQAAPLLEIVETVETARELEAALIVASSKLADLLQVGMCAIALSHSDSEEAIARRTLQDERAKVRVVAIHPPTAASTVPPQIRLSAYEGLQVAYEQHQVTVAPSPQDDPWLVPLYEALGLRNPTSLATFPLEQDQQVLGLLLLGNPIGRYWREEELDGILVVARMLAKAIAAAEAQRQQPRVPSLAPQRTDEEQRHLDEVLQQAKTQIQALNARIKTLVQEIKVRDEEILALNSELEAHGRGNSEKELEVWQNEVRQLADERETLQRKIKELTQDRDVLLNDRARLSDELIRTKQQLSQVETHRESLEAELSRRQPRGLGTELEIPLVPASIAEAPVESISEERTPSSRTAVPQEPWSIVLTDAEGQIVMADALARQALRLPEGDIIGAPINGAFPDPRWSEAIHDLLDPAGSNTTDRTHLDLSMRDRDSTLEADLVALRGRQGEIAGLAITLRTPESETERYEALISIANDLRAPMTSITGYTDLLLGEQAGILTEMQQQFLERVKANVEQLNHLLNDLIHAASPSARPLELSPQPVNLTDIIEEAIMGLSARFRERRLAVQLELSPELPLMQADRDSLYQVILRLLSNAVLCSEAQTQIRVSAHEKSSPHEGQQVEVSVTDTGGGIAPDDYPRVFRHFYRAHQPLVQGMGETGVGMAMAKTLIEAQGGRIWVESVPGSGSTFSFLLPSAR